jgi:hypothetical protein
MDRRVKPGGNSTATFAYLMPSSSTSNISVAFGGMTLPAPYAP